MSIKIKVIQVGAFEVNCAIVSDEDGNAWIVDPGAEAELPLAYIKDNRLTLRRVLITHGHIDHISGLNDIVAAYQSVPIMLHDDDAAWAFTDINSFPPYISIPDCPACLTHYGDGDIVEDGQLSAKIFHTPGHSPGGVCILTDGGPLFSGDTLFARSVGRTDLAGGNGAKLAESLRRLAELPDSTNVIPGHGPFTTIGDEKRENPFLSLGRKWKSDNK